MEIPSNRPRHEVEAILRSIPDAIKGTGPDQYGLGIVYRSALAHSLLTSIYEGYIVKSLGGTDDCGHSWPDISPWTKAYHRPSARAGLELPGPKRRPTLDATQDRVWRAIFADNLTRSMKDVDTFTPRPSRRKPKSPPPSSSSQKRTEPGGFFKKFSAKFNSLFGKKRKAIRSLFKSEVDSFNAFQSAISMEEADAQSNAAKLAWNYVKARLGATTLMMLLGDANLPIMDETGRLKNSYKPGPLTFPYLATNPDQDVSLGPGRVHVDSRVPYKPPRHHKRSPIPPNIEPWVKKAKLAAKEQLVIRLREIL